MSTNLSSFTASPDPSILFGKYLSDEEARLVRDAGYTLFVDLTTKDEITWAPYVLPPETSLIVLPIPDRQPIGKTLEEKQLYHNTIESLLTHLDKGRCIYIHCRGGHGRSGTMAAILYALRQKVDATEALRVIKEAHQKRIVMSDKMRKLGAPQTAAQKRFVISFVESWSKQ